MHPRWTRLVLALAVAMAVASFVIVPEVQPHAVEGAEWLSGTLF